MISAVDFVSVSRMERMTGIPNAAVISITDSDSSDAQICSKFGLLLRLKFDDLDHESMAAGSTGVVFRPEDAGLIIAFLEHVQQHRELETLTVHCEMGRSRSAAVAWFAACVYGARFLCDRRIDGINTLVLGMLEQAAGKSVPRPKGLIVQAGSPSIGI